MPRCPPIAPSCRSASTSVRSSSGITNWIISSLPSEGSNRRHRMPSWTNSWSQSCSSLHEDRLVLPISSAAGFSPASLPRSIRPRVESASCASRSLWIGGASGGHTFTAETCFSASKSWLFLPHCLQGRRERASAAIIAQDIGREDRSRGTEDPSSSQEHLMESAGGAMSAVISHAIALRAGPCNRKTRNPRRAGPSTGG